MNPVSVYRKYKVSYPDLTDFYYYDKDFKLLSSNIGASCFTGFGYARYSTDYDFKSTFVYGNEDIVFVKIQMLNTTTRKSSQFFMREWDKAGLFEYVDAVEITETHVAMIVDLRKVTPQLCFYLYTIMRMMAIQPVYVFFFKRICLSDKDDKVDFAHKLLLAHKFNVHMGGNPSHYYASPVWKKLGLTFKGIVEYVNSRFKVDRTCVKSGLYDRQFYAIGNTGNDWFNLIAKYPTGGADKKSYNFKLNKTNLDMLINNTIKGEYFE